MDSFTRRTLQTLASLSALAALPRAWAQVRAVESVPAERGPSCWLVIHWVRFTA